MKNCSLLFIFSITAFFAGACLNPPAAVEKHPCELAQNCIYDAAAGSSDCKEGYTWENPDDASNYNCVLMDSCQPVTCETQGFNCGDVPDGCGTTLNCGSCPEGQTCGADGPNICGEGSCTPTPCAAQGANCGSISDGCGEILDCGTCPEGQTCGGGGVSNLCGSPTTEPPSELDNAHLLQSKMSISGYRESRRYCKVTPNNNMMCWGWNHDSEASNQSESGSWVGTDENCNLGAFGQVRCLETSSYSSSMNDISLPAMQQISASGSYLAGITTEGTLLSWKAYTNEALDEADPAPTGTDFVSTTLNGKGACGLRDDGSIACWKHVNTYDDDYNLFSPPTGHTYKQVSLAPNNGCGLTTEGKVICWGVTDGTSFRDYGQVTDAPTDDGYVAIATHEEVVCALKNNGQVRCWGSNHNGVQTRFTVDDPDKATLTMGDEEVCVQTESNEIICLDSVVPQLMATTHQDVSVCLESICAITAAGEALCEGKLNENADWLYEWDQINANAPYTHIATWSPHGSITNNPNILCTVSQSGRLRCWGGGGQSSRTVELFNDVSALSNEVFTHIDVGINFGCGLNASGEVVCFGESGDYLPPGSGYVSLDVGEILTVAVDASGQMLCWGSSGQCAPETMTFKKASADKSGHYTYPNTWGIDTDDKLHQWGFDDTLTPAGSYKEIDAGGNVACAITTSGSLECWGMNQEPPIGSNFTKVVADTDQACALTTEGKLACWGDVFIPTLE